MAVRFGMLPAILGAAALAAAAQAADDPDALPEGPGRETTFYACSACHSFGLVSRQGLGRALWDDTLRLMVDRHGMEPLPPEDRAVILDYLSMAYPPRAQGGWTSPFARP